MKKGVHNGTPNQFHRGGRKGIHHSLLFWAGFFLLLGAILFYVLSDDLSWVRQVH